MGEVNRVNLASAVQDFRRARRRAALDAIVSRLTGRSSDLLSYDEVRRKLKATASSARGLHEIPLDAIVGSVGRYTDFTRNFLPRNDRDEDRWARVKAAMLEGVGLPPIEVYKIGDAYFVRDGNHRVSIARELGATHIEAYVTEIHTKVPLASDAKPDDLILKAEQIEFLEHTQIDRIRPQADLTLTVPGGYETLEDHIAVHRYYMGLDWKRDISYDEAVGHWYDEVYLPVVRIIRERGLLHDFPGRTEADLYLWVSEHHSALEEQLGWEVSHDAAVSDLATRSSPRPMRVVTRVLDRVRDLMTPDQLELGPPPGQWRREYLGARQESQLFADLLVAVNGEESGWRALQQALEVAWREGAKLHGLYVVPNEVDRDGAQSVREEFDRRCREANVSGRLVVEVGKIARIVSDRSRWTDLIVMALTHPPGMRLLMRLQSGIRTIIKRSSRPVLVIPDQAAPSRFERALLAYNGSAKSEEALIVATYLAGKHHMSLTLLTVSENRAAAQQKLEHAQSYIEKHSVQAEYVIKNGFVADAILRALDEYQADLLLIGGYKTELLHVLQGNVLDRVLSKSQKPMLIAR